MWLDGGLKNIPNFKSFNSQLDLPKAGEINTIYLIKDARIKLIWDDDKIEYAQVIIGRDVK